MTTNPAPRPALWAVVKPWVGRAALVVAGGVAGGLAVEVTRRIEWRADDYRAEIRALLLEARRREAERRR